MSSTDSHPTAPTEPGPAASVPGEGPRPSRASGTLVVVALVALGALVWALNPRQPKLSPAPLEPPRSTCPPSHADFVPSNITAVPDPPLDTLPKEPKNRVLLRMNMEPCGCGCGQSIAACRINDRTCATSEKAANSILNEENGNAASAPAANR